MAFTVQSGEPSELLAVSESVCTQAATWADNRGSEGLRLGRGLEAKKDRPLERAKLIQLAIACPNCGPRGARRVAAWRLELYRAQPRDRVTETVSCRCGELYPVTVKAYLRGR